MSKEEEKKTCPRCGGTGTVWNPSLMSMMYGGEVCRTCPRCGGTGKVKK